MENKYQKKIDKEILEVINPIRNNWNNFTEEELENLLKKFGNICRDETSVLRKDILSDDELLSSLIKIGNKYNNPKILIEIVSSINNMIERYNLKITDKAFQFLLSQTKNRKVNFYVSIFITRLSQFADYEQKWDYIMSIPNIAPKKKSINTFYRVIKDNLNNIPNKFKPDIINILERHLDTPNLHETTIKKYLEIILQLKNISN